MEKGTAEVGSIWPSDLSICDGQIDFNWRSLSVIRVTGWVKCVHVYRELEMQSVHFWPNAVNA